MPPHSPGSREGKVISFLVVAEEATSGLVKLLLLLLLLSLLSWVEAMPLYLGLLAFLLLPLVTLPRLRHYLLHMDYIA